MTYRALGKNSHHSEGDVFIGDIAVNVSIPEFRELIEQLPPVVEVTTPAPVVHIEAPKPAEVNVLVDVPKADPPVIHVAPSAATVECNPQVYHTIHITLAAKHVTLAVISLLLVCILLLTYVAVRPFVL